MPSSGCFSPKNIIDSKTPVLSSIASSQLGVFFIALVGCSVVLHRCVKAGVVPSPGQMRVQCTSTVCQCKLHQHLPKIVG